MRILDNSTARLDLTDLGFLPGNYERYAASFTKPYGMILVTGPTGSGKSTTLYATLNIVNRPEVNIITVEDPVEYRLAGVNQVQTNVKAGLTFAAALRSILRSDPDVVLIGEIRDHETAQIAVEASLTGHLVLSTLHTNDASSAVTRLIEMGIEPFLVGSALDCVLAQRLARRLCPKCKEPYTPTPEALRAARFPWDTSGSRCPRSTGRWAAPTAPRPATADGTALHEVMPMTEPIERLAVERATSAAIERAGGPGGHGQLRNDGMARRSPTGSPRSTRCCASWSDVTAALKQPRGRADDTGVARTGDACSRGGAVDSSAWQATLTAVPGRPSRAGRTAPAPPRSWTCRRR